MTKIAFLANRGVVELTGPDRVSFLNGLVSNDVAKAAPGCAVWAALLTPQGKYLLDLFVFSDGERLLLDVARAEIPAFLQKLRRFKLRAQLEIADVSEQFTVHAVWAGTPAAQAFTAQDPRLPEAGYRSLDLPVPTSDTATEADYAAHRIGLGLPDGPPDLEPEKTLLLEAGFDELNGIDWQKGCYMGQELTARTKYRGLVKRRLLPVTLSEPHLSVGTAVHANGREVGTIRSSVGTQALAMLQLSALDQPLSVAGTELTFHVPGWLKQPGLG